MFAMLAGQRVETLTQRPAEGRTKAFSYSVVGGVPQTVSGRLAGDVNLNSDELVDQLSAIVDAFRESESNLFGD